jgi:ketosteroid isomerase-like protein
MFRDGAPPGASLAPQAALPHAWTALYIRPAWARDTGWPVSQGNVEIVRSFYEAWARDEFPGPVELMDPQIEYVNPAGAVEPGTRRGLAAFSGAFEKVFQGWETWQMEPEGFRAVGDQVAVVVRYRARGRGSGVEVEGRESALWTLRDGKVLRYAWLHEPADALKAAGLAD